MDPATAGTVATSFLEKGVLGTVIVALMLICGALWRAYSNSVSERISDLKANTDKHVDLIEQVIDAQKDSMSILQSIKDRLERRR